MLSLNSEAHMDLEGLTVDREVLRLKEGLQGEFSRWGLLAVRRRQGIKHSCVQVLFTDCQCSCVDPLLSLAG